MEQFNDLPPRQPMHETFRPAERAGLMAQAILNEIGQVPLYPPDKQQPTSAAKWSPSILVSVNYQLLKFEHGSSGKRYHFDIIATDGSPLARFMIYTGSKKQAFITQLDAEGKRMELNKTEQRMMHAKVLGLLTNSIPRKAEEIMGRLINEEFNALMGRFIISDLALEFNGQVPIVSAEAALHAADAHRQHYDHMMSAYGLPRTETFTASNDEDDSQTVSFEITAARAAVDIAHKWHNTFNRDTPPEQRIRRAS